MAALADIVDKLDADNLAPVYLLHGAERFVIDRALARMREIAVAGPMGELNYQRLKAGEASGVEIVAAAREVPMMASRRLVRVDAADKLKAADWEALDPYLDDPAPQSCLVLVATKFDMRRGPLRRAAKRGQVYGADPLAERGIPSFVNERAAARGLSISPGAVAALAAAVGPDGGALDDAVERLGLFAGDREIGADDVGEVVTAVRQLSVFELVEAIGRRQRERALKLLGELLSRREEPLRLNALVARHYRQLLLARVHLHLRTDRASLPGVLGVPPFVVGKLLDQSRRFRGVELERALARLAVADRELKSSRRPGELVFGQAVMELCLGS